MSDFERVSVIDHVQVGDIAGRSQEDEDVNKLHHWDENSEALNGTEAAGLFVLFSDLGDQ